MNLFSVFKERRYDGRNMFIISDSQLEATTALGHLTKAFKLHPR